MVCAWMVSFCFIVDFRKTSAHAHRQIHFGGWLQAKLYVFLPLSFIFTFAHMPMLTNQPYVDFLENLSGLALKHIDNKWAIELLSRIYWFTIEFGLIREEGQIKIYGAGILSSAGETKYSLSDVPSHYEYDVKKILNTPYWKDKFQDKYFIIESYEQLFESLPEIEEFLEEMVAEEMKKN